MKVAICFGTRPEIIKLSLLSEKLSKKFDVYNVFTGQHDSLFEDVKHLIPNIHYLIPNFRQGYESLNNMYSDLICYLGDYFSKEKISLVIVQGDTASAYCASFCAYMLGIKVGHVEAGLRTNNIWSPFPEEFNRQVIDKISSYNWCPSKLAYNNLIKENVSGEVVLTGNTIVDFVNKTVDQNKISKNNKIVITLHRRENEKLFENILMQINEIAAEYPWFEFIFPAHPNPIIQTKLGILKGKNVLLVPPIRCEEFVKLLSGCCGIITDSGGIQEEAVCLKKKALVCRSNTERQEGIDVGICRLVGSDIKNNFKWLFEPFNVRFENPYGDGSACDKIINSLRCV